MSKKREHATRVEYEQLLAEVERLRAIIKSARAALNGDSTQKVAREMASLAEILESVDKWPGLRMRSGPISESGKQ